MEFKLKTERLVIQSFDNCFLEEYYKEFTDEIVKYQYPDRFSSLSQAEKVLSEFEKEMEDGKMLELVILTQSGEFVGSMEVFGLTEKAPEIGLWLKESAQGKGYGYEALKCLSEHLNAKHNYPYFIYEVDVRNLPSIRLVEKFRFEKIGIEEVTTASNKKLKLQTYHFR